MRILFSVPGEPKGKGRPRFSNIGSFTKTYTPKETAVYENLVRMEFQNAAQGRKFPDDAYLDMRIIAYYQIPKSTSKKKHDRMLRSEIRPSKKPDMDNVIKIIADALNGIAYHDDTQIVDCQVRKFYSDMPRVVVQIEDITSMEDM